MYEGGMLIHADANANYCHLPTMMIHSFLAAATVPL